MTKKELMQNLIRLKGNCLDGSLPNVCGSCPFNMTNDCDADNNLLTYYAAIIYYLQYNDITEEERNYLTTELVEGLL